MKQMRHFILGLVGLIGVATANPIQFYAGVQGGLNSFSGLPGTVTLSDANNFKASFSSSQTEAFAYRIYGGALFYTVRQFSFGAELGYLKPHDVHYHSDGASGQYYSMTAVNTVASYMGLDLLGVVNYQLTNKFSLLGKLGMAEIWERVSSDTNGFGAAAPVLSANKLCPELGLGFAYMLNQHLDVNFTANRIFADSMSDNSNFTDPGANFKKVPSMNFYALGLNYRF